MLNFQVEVKNDETIALTRNGSTLRMGVHDSFRISVLLAGSKGIMFHAHDINWNYDEGEFNAYDRMGDEFIGLAEPLWIGLEAVKLLSEKGLASPAEMAPYGDDGRRPQRLPKPNGDSDTKLMLQLSLLGCPIDPFYDQSPTDRLFGGERKLAGYRVSLHNGQTFILDVDGKLPKMSEELRTAARAMMAG